MHAYLPGSPVFLVVLPFAVAAGLASSTVAARRAGVPLGHLYRAQALTVLLTLAGAKGLSLLEQLMSGATPHLAWNSGYRYPGGIVALLLGLPLLRRALSGGVGLATLLDVSACGAGVAMAVMRISCLLSGCCVGPPCSYAWCISFSHGLPEELAQPTPPVHPLQIYFMINSLFASAICLRLMGRRAYAGQVFWTYLALHETGKALLESLREPYVPMLQLVSFALALVGVTALLWNARARRPRDRDDVASGGRFEPVPVLAVAGRKGSVP
jgi:phosphatidylglycerol:prolipoprotein diacylglycerol transferase